MKTYTLEDKVAAVVIGRNEGQRLVECFRSLLKQTKNIIYVDSGSTDGSIEIAKSLSVKVVGLNMDEPFTAARARNIGFEALKKNFPKISFVQFIDGDCKCEAEWLRTALDFVEKSPDVAVVCGRRKEINPGLSVYNRLCDMEWNTPIGEAKACGGDALMRVSVLSQVNGFDAGLIAGEEPELCVRIRQNGWKIWRLDAAMTLHDAAITKFSQWWKRASRAGYAFTEGAYLHGKSAERHWVVESNRIWFWGIVLPILILSSLFFSLKLSIALFLIYPLQLVRLTVKSDQEKEVAFQHAFFSVLGKFAEATGKVKFWFNHYLKKQARLIEYK